MPKSIHNLNPQLPKEIIREMVDITALLHKIEILIDIKISPKIIILNKRCSNIITATL